MLQLKEFLDENSHRSYPFRTPNNVPTELILDMHILISGIESTIDYKDRVGISRVVVSKTGMSITFVIVDEGSTTDIGTIHVPITDPKASHTFSLYKNGILVDGSITTGYFDNSFIGTYNIPTDTCMLFEGCVIPVTNWCTGLVINDKLYTGLVTINAGDGIVIETATSWRDDKQRQNFPAGTVTLVTEDGVSGGESGDEPETSLTQVEVYASYLESPVAEMEFNGTYTIQDSTKSGKEAVYVNKDNYTELWWQGTYWCMKPIGGGYAYIIMYNRTGNDPWEDVWSLNFKLKEYTTVDDSTIRGTINKQFETIVDTQGFIKTINGVSPDSKGNINITVGEPVTVDAPNYVEGATILYDGSLVNSIDIDTGHNSSIVIRDAITPFCYDEATFTIDDAVLETLKSNATELSDRVQAIENHLTAVESNLNTVNMQLVKMG